ncbi:uncharacterized protein LOC143065221 [Mytilus galloprovincialis]|uniref:uncharacterized protein LOC143065221 n=1 Tax=Mytilus galloprovincialis TaxID=29158 RepID=UPI003F7BD632
MAGVHDDDEKKYNEMLKPITYKSDDNRKYKYRHEDLIWRSKYRAIKGRIHSLKRLHLLYDKDEEDGKEKVIEKPKDSDDEPNKVTLRDYPISMLEDIGMFSVFSDDTSTKNPSLKLSRDPARMFRGQLHQTELKSNQAYGGFDVPKSLAHYGKFKGKIPEVRATVDGALRDYGNDRVKMWNLNIRNDERYAHFNQMRSQSGLKRKRIQFQTMEKGTQSSTKAETEVQTVHPVERRDSFDLTMGKERSEVSTEEIQSKPKLELKAGLEKADIAAIDFLDGFDRLGEQDCQKMINEIYFKPDEDIISSIYVLQSDIPSVQLMNIITVRIPVKIRFDSEKLKFFIRMRVGLVWRRIDARFEETPGNSIFEGYVVFKTEIRGNFFATCDFIQFTYKVDKHGYKFKNALIPDIQVAVKGGVLDEPEDVTFQVRLIDRERFSKYDDVCPRLIYPITYISDGLWIRRNKLLYSKRISPLLITIMNDISYGIDSEVYLIREKQGRINIIGCRTSTDKKFIVMLDHTHSTFWYVVTKEINKYKAYEPILERGFSVASSRTCVCKILTFHENKKEEFNIWVCIVEHPDVDNTVSKYLGLGGVADDKRLEMSDDGGISRTIDFVSRSSVVNIDLDGNFKQRHYKELPTLQFSVGHSCRVKFKIKCRIKPLLCDDKEKVAVIRFYIGTKTIHEVIIDTAAPIPDFDVVPKIEAPEYTKEAIEKLLSAESLHKLAACLSEDEGFDLSIRLGVPAGTVSKVLIMIGSVESKNFRLILLWKQSIKGDVSDVKDFINSFHDIERGDLAFGIMDALDNCRPFKK